MCFQAVITVITVFNKYYYRLWNAAKTLLLKKLREFKTKHKYFFSFF